MSTQQMAHAQITIPADCLALVADLVTKLGGSVLDESGLCLPCNPMPELERGGKMLKGLRQRAGLTQKQVADALGLPQSHISEFEKNKRSVPYKHAKKLAVLLQSIPSHFMTPNAETLEAMRELEESKGECSASVEEFFKDLGI
jgi:Predicted transcriptional regulators